MMKGNSNNKESIGRMTQMLRSFEWFDNVPNAVVQRDQRKNRENFTLTIKFREDS